MLDSSFLVSFYLEKDSNCPKAKEQMALEKETELVLAENILHETLTVLSCRQDIAFAKQVYRELTQNQKIQIYHFTPHETQEVLDLFFMLGRKLSVPDVGVIYLARRLKAEVLAFDEEIIRQTGSH